MGSVEPSETFTRPSQAFQAPYSFAAVIHAGNFGDALVRAYWEYHLEACSIQEFTIRDGNYLCESADRVTINDTVLIERLEVTQTIGAIPVSRRPTPKGPRCRGFPYDSTEAEYIPQKMRKDAARGRLIFSPARTTPDSAPIVCCPTATVRKRLPDRRCGEERRVIWDGRFANLIMPKSDYYRPIHPKIKDVAEHITSLRREYPISLRSALREI